jgi:hypothetical protein
VVGVVAHRI